MYLSSKKVGTCVLKIYKYKETIIFEIQNQYLVNRKKFYLNKFIISTCYYLILPLSLRIQMLALRKEAYTSSSKLKLVKNN